MITFRDALFLASTKFRTRKGRNIFSACVMALGLVIILSFYSGTAAATKLIQEVFVDSTADRFFVKTIYQPSTPPLTGGEGSVTSQAVYPEIASNPELYASTYASSGVIAAYHAMDSNELEGFTLGGALHELRRNQYDSRMLQVVDDIFLQDFMLDGQSLTMGADGSVPVIVSKEYVLPGDYFAGVEGIQKTQKELYADFQAGKEAHINATYPLARAGEPRPAGEDQEIVNTEVRVRIVGFLPLVFAGEMVEASAIIIPRSVYEANLELHQFFVTPQAHWMIGEMADREARDAFFVAAQQRMQLNVFDSAQGFVQSAPSRFEMFAELLSFLRGVGYGVGGFLLVVSSLFLLSTLGKVISDSKREIGVFRAIGAKKRDVKAIYFMYAWLLSTVAFAIACVISTALIILVSQRYGDSFYYQLLNNGIKSTVERPWMIFFGLTPMSMLVCYFGTVGIGFLAAFFPVMRAARTKTIDVLRAL